MRCCNMASITFQSTPSARRATHNGSADVLTNYISIHALREEGDGTFLSIPSSAFYFNPRPPRGGRPFEGAPANLD